jgi:hypothetical protein
MTVSVNGTNGLTFNDATTQNTSAFYGGLAMRNRIINGAMVIDQRNAGASVSITPSTGYAVDRFQAGIAQGSSSTAQQSISAPAGFTSSLLVTIGTGASPAAGNVSRTFQAIEGFNTADLGFGLATASTITLSFWVKSSLTGTFAGGLYNNAANRTYVFTYAISTANTWEQKSVTIAGDTSGTWLTNNGAGIIVNWDLGSGSTYQGTAGVWAAGAAWATSGSVKLAATSGATWSVTGVQLEKGSTATSFDYRPYGTELALCKRYYNKTTTTIGVEGVALNGASIAYCQQYVFPSTMRLAPTCTSNGFNDASNMNGSTITDISPESVSLRGTTFSGVAVPTKATGYWSAGIQFSAEL